MPDALLFTEAGADGRLQLSPNGSLTIATHIDLRYIPSVNAAPFRALSSVGGDISALGGQQTLRGYGDSSMVLHRDPEPSAAFGAGSWERATRPKAGVDAFPAAITLQNSPVDR